VIEFTKTSVISFISNPFSKRVQYEASVLLQQFSGNNKLGASTIIKIHRLLDKSIVTELRTIEELLACLVHTFTTHAALDFDDSLQIVGSVLNTMDKLLPKIHPVKGLRVVNLIFNITSAIADNYLGLFNTAKLFYPILLKFLCLQDGFTIKSLILVKDIFLTLDDRISQGSDFTVSLVQNGIVSHLYRLMVQHEYDSESRVVLLAVLIIVTYASKDGVKAVIQVGFLPILLHLLQNQEDLDCITVILQNILCYHFHDVLMESGIVSQLIVFSLTQSDSVFKRYYCESFYRFCMIKCKEFSKERDPLAFQPRIRTLLNNINNQTDDFYEQTVITMIKSKAF
jgi:hypothetical protein